MSPDEQIENPNHEIAYSALEDLFRTKKISGAHVAELRAAYGRMQIDLESRRTYRV